MAALPIGKKVVAINTRGKMETRLEGAPLRAPISVASNSISGDLLVADNAADLLILVPAKQGEKPQVIQRIRGAEANLQSMSVALAKDGHVLFGTEKPMGIYRLWQATRSVSRKNFLSFSVFRAPQRA